ncbi:hypothetical protein EOI86_13290 [Hwanghaeella grinnelliae]|uniref:Uncharacterized protein n=1 Tax=Hwanghaeella grinnelliae TaxID=2500179 RepID=A0A3S2WRJ4_9PROT|nr:hypothetical protein [Hwanghaeella grinnelliae]RVU36193.1 hypothetical protein EOI86_13290 [Hwanghaeella grinnelliae]
MTASLEESPDLREGWNDLFRGDLKQAAERFQTQLTATDDPGAAAGLLLCAAVMGAGDAVAALLSDRWTRRRDAAAVLWRAAWICAVNGSDQGLDRLKTALSGFGEGSREQATLHYAAGHMAMLRGDEDAALAGFLAAKRGFDADPEWFLAARDQTLTNVFVQTGHLLPAEQVAALAQSVGTPPVFEKDEQNQPHILVAADGGYLRRFGPDFVESLNRTNPGASLSVLAVDAAPEDTAALAAAGPSLFLGIEHETAEFPGINRPAVYASWRFLAMEKLLLANKRPVLVLDMDLIVRAPLDPLFDVMKTGKPGETGDFGCWLRPDGGPGGIVRGGATGFAPSADSWWMATLTAAYIRARFAEERENLWFVDQAALWRGALAAKKNRPGFRLADFSQAGLFTDFFELVRDEDVKRR